MPMLSIRCTAMRQPYGQQDLLRRRREAALTARSQGRRASPAAQPHGSARRRRSGFPGPTNCRPSVAGTSWIRRRAGRAAGGREHTGQRRPRKGRHRRWRSSSQTEAVRSCRRRLPHIDRNAGGVVALATKVAPALVRSRCCVGGGRTATIRRIASTGSVGLGRPHRRPVVRGVDGRERSGSSKPPRLRRSKARGSTRVER